MDKYGQIGLNINLLNSGNANLLTPIYYLETAPNSLIGSQALYPSGVETMHMQRHAPYTDEQPIARSLGVI